MAKNKNHIWMYDQQTGSEIGFCYQRPNGYGFSTYPLVSKLAKLYGVSTDRVTLERCKYGHISYDVFIDSEYRLTIESIPY